MPKELKRRKSNDENEEHDGNEERDENEERDPSYAPEKKRQGNSSNFFGRLKKGHTAIRFVSHPSLSPASNKAHQTAVLKDLTNTIGPTFRNDAKTPTKTASTANPATPVKTNPSAANPANTDPLTPSDELVTGSGRKLHKVRAYRHARVYAEKEFQEKPKPAAQKVLNFDEEVIVQKVPAPASDSKKRTFNFDNASRVKRALFPSKRNPTQKQVAGNISANEYAEATMHPEELVQFNVSMSKNEKQEWEWTHLVAYSHEGPSAQSIQNMICATKAFNTVTSFLEDIDNYLDEFCKRHGKVYTKEVSGQLAYVTRGDKQYITHNLKDKLVWKFITPYFTEVIELDTKYQYETPTASEKIMVNRIFKDLFNRIKEKADAVKKTPSTPKL